MRDYLIGCDVLGDDGTPAKILGANVESPVFLDESLMKAIEDEFVIGDDVEIVGKHRKNGGVHGERHGGMHEARRGERYGTRATRSEIVGKGGGGGGHGGHGGHHGGGGFRGGGLWGRGPGWWGGWGPWYDVETEPLVCARYDANGNCLEYVPVDAVIGAFDFNVESKRMDSLKQVTVGVAQELLKGGQAAIDGAIAGAKQPWYKPNLPGDASRATVKGKLQWHAATLAPLVGNKNAIYASGEDLKHWVLMAFREANAVEEGAAYIQSAWDEMWSQIAKAVAALPHDIAKKVGDVSFDIVKAATGVPVWGWAIIGTVVLGGVGYFIYKMAGTPAVAAAARHV